MGAELFHAQAAGQTDMTKQIVASCNFANVPKNYVNGTYWYKTWGSDQYIL
jgi:hypothetical protein